MVTTAKTRGGRLVSGLALELRGSGAPTVQLHGLTSSRRRDEKLLLDLTKAQKGLRVLRYDARGHGASEGSANPADYTWPSLAADLLALLDAVFPGQQVHGVGQSMGAATLITAAVSEPDRFASLSLAIPPTAWDSRMHQAANYEAIACVVEASGGAAFAEATREEPLPPAADPQRPFTYPDVEDRWLPAVFRGAGESDLPSPDQLASLEIPTLVLAWNGDRSHPVEVAREIASLIGGAKITVADTPAQVAQWPQRIGDFIRQLGT